MAKLQIALDCNDSDTALQVLEEVYPYVDIAELGTPLMVAEGAAGIRRLRKEYPALTLLADIKLMDGGGPIASIAFEAGADIVTVLGVASDLTIRGVAEAAEKYGKKSFVDLICAKDPEKRAMQIDGIGADYIGVHTSYDLREEKSAPLEDLKKLKACVKNAEISISGGIRLEMLDSILEAEPDIIVTGSSIMNSMDRRGTAKALYEKIHEMDNKGFSERSEGKYE